MFNTDFMSEFPYSNQHEMNLDWILQQLKKFGEVIIDQNHKLQLMDGRITALEKRMDDLWDDVTAQLPGYVQDAMDKFLADGTLADIINNDMMFRPGAKKKERYQEYIRQSLTSYLVRNTGSECVSGQVLDDVVFKYANLKDYAGVFGIGSFNYKDKIAVGGTDKHVIYLDCTTFLSLVLRGRRYENSVYPYVFGCCDPIEDDKIFDLAVENPDINMDFTMDWFNNLSTNRDAFIMENSGCNLRELFVSTTTADEINQVTLGHLETGDLIFLANSSKYSSGNWNGVYHCMFYVKTLDELNKYAIASGVTLNALPSGNTDQYGYVVEFNLPTDGNYKNSLAIRKLSDYFTTKKPSDSWYIAYVSKPVSNSLNSNKYMRQISGKNNYYKFQNIYNPAKTYSNKIKANLSEGSMALNSVGVGGIKMPDTNANKVKTNGVYTCWNESVLPTITNIPSNTYFFTLISMGFLPNGLSGVQIFLQHNTGKMWSRANGSDTPTADTWSEWLPLN